MGVSSLGMVSCLLLIALTTVGQMILVFRAGGQTDAVANGRLYTNCWLRDLIGGEKAKREYETFERRPRSRWILLNRRTIGAHVSGLHEVSLWWPAIVFGILPGRAAFARYRVVVRRRRNQCVNCGYRLYGLAQRRCPECGTDADEE